MRALSTDRIGLSCHREVEQLGALAVHLEDELLVSLTVPTTEAVIFASANMSITFCVTGGRVRTKPQPGKPLAIAIDRHPQGRRPSDVHHGPLPLVSTACRACHLCQDLRCPFELTSLLPVSFITICLRQVAHPYGRWYPMQRDGWRSVVKIMAIITSSLTARCGCR